jgi:hypothetical protein
MVVIDILDINFQTAQAHFAHKHNTPDIQVPTLTGKT